MVNPLRIRKEFMCLATAALVLILLAGPAALASENSSGGIRLTVLYDNTAAVEGVRADWGFACLIEGTEKTILFDTGTKPDVLEHNIRALGIDLSRVGLVVLSHQHGDHTGGLSLVLDTLRGKEVAVTMPESFSADFIQKVEQAGVRPVKVKEFKSIGPGVYVTGEMGGPIKEIGLILDTADGPLLVTGCAHPGIADMIQESGRCLGRKISIVLGGFHLLNLDEPALKALVGEIQTLGVRKCGATHCTGEKAIRAFQEAYGSDFLPLGVGRQVIFRPLP
jgi:7,8-dihydropterin-6-yl-methyl-4-(beta-D-ribofuranosyl)aminobenzene 5'-phosphate synthase